MNSGIYLIEFKDSSFYIGRSGNIEKRVRAHINLLKNNAHYNYKLLNKYKSVGAPTDVLVLESCDISLQIGREIFWIDIFDATEHGLNISRGGDDFGIGENNPAAKYSNNEIEEVLKLIVKCPDKSLKYISDISGVSYGIVREIAKGTTHFWLRDKYPEEYAEMLLLKGTRVSKNKGLSAKDRGIIYPKVVSSTGDIHSIDNARQFSIKWGLDSGSLNKLIQGKQKSHKGWRLATES